MSRSFACGFSKYYCFFLEACVFRPGPYPVFHIWKNIDYLSVSNEPYPFLHRLRNLPNCSPIWSLPFLKQIWSTTWIIYSIYRIQILILRHNVQENTAKNLQIVMYLLEVLFFSRFFEILVFWNLSFFGTYIHVFMDNYTTLSSIGNFFQSSTALFKFHIERYNGHSCLCARIWKPHESRIAKISKYLATLVRDGLQL